MIVEDSFLRTQDDAFYSRGRGIKRCVIWMDANGAAFTLFGQRVEQPLIIDDIDVLYARASWHRWGGGRIFSLRAEGDVGDMGGVGITFRNIRVTEPYPTYQTFWIQSASDHENSFMDDKIGQGLEDVVFQNISVAARSVYGYAKFSKPVVFLPAITTLSNVRFRIRASAWPWSTSGYTNEFVTNITFK